MARVLGLYRRPFQLVFAIGVLVATVFAAPLMLRAQNPGAPAAQAVPGAPKVPGPDMQAMGRGFRTIGMQVADATKNDSTLTLLAAMETSSLSAKEAVPPLVAALPEAERAAKLKAYKQEMVKLIRQELELEEQLLDGDNTKAAASVAALNSIMASGHMDFRPARRGGPGRGPAPAPGAGRQ